MHYKITPFEGQHTEVINAVHRADWIDAGPRAPGHARGEHRVTIRWLLRNAAEDGPPDGRP